jgi:hypothetical protein
MRKGRTGNLKKQGRLYVDPPHQLRAACRKSGWVLPEIRSADEAQVAARPAPAGCVIN